MNNILCDEIKYSELLFDKCLRTYFSNVRYSNVTTNNVYRHFVIDLYYYLNNNQSPMNGYTDFFKSHTKKHVSYITSTDVYYKFYSMITNIHYITSCYKRCKLLWSLLNINEKDAFSSQIESSDLRFMY